MSNGTVASAQSLDFQGDSIEIIAVTLQRDDLFTNPVISTMSTGSRDIRLYPNSLYIQERLFGVNAYPFSRVQISSEFQGLISGVITSEPLPRAPNAEMDYHTNLDQFLAYLSEESSDSSEDSTLEARLADFFERELAAGCQAIGRGADIDLIVLGSVEPADWHQMIDLDGITARWIDLDLIGPTMTDSETVTAFISSAETMTEQLVQIHSCKT